VDVVVVEVVVVVVVVEDAEKNDDYTNNKNCRFEPNAAADATRFASAATTAAANARVVCELKMVLQKQNKTKRNKKKKKNRTSNFIAFDDYDIIELLDLIRTLRFLFLFSVSNQRELSLIAHSIVHAQTHTLFSVLLFASVELRVTGTS
jgi:hypothetical protein